LILNDGNMKNPFLDFKHITVTDPDLPLDRLVRENRRVLDDLLAAYRGLPQDRVKEFCRLLSHGLKFNAYKAWLLGLELPKFVADTLDSASSVYASSLRMVGEIQYAPHDIEELCGFIGLSREADFELRGPMGLYLSALINASDERFFRLDLHPYPVRHHFLGFRLEADKNLLVKGDLGHFSGAGLCGGFLEVNGSTGSWCGAGMASGHIHIAGNALSKTGERMTGGQISVDGSIREIARQRSGGEIRNASEVFAPLAHGKDNAQ
jgi:hypothetical protein